MGEPRVAGGGGDTPGPGGGAPPSLRVWTAILVLLFLCHLVPMIDLVDDQERGFLWGDALYYALAAGSLAERGTLDLVPQLTAEQVEAALAEHQLARSSSGALVMKHSSILPFVGAPFFSLFGARGLLFLNVLFTAGIVAGMVPLSRRYVGTVPALCTAYLLGTATLISPFAYNFSADVAGVCVLVAGLCVLFGGAPLSAGVLLGVSVSLKMSLLPVVAALCAVAPLLPLARGDVRSAAAVLVRVALGAAFGIAPMLALNQVQFGSIFVTGYQRIALPDGGTLSHVSDFNQPMIMGVAKNLFDGAHGILSTNPILLLAALGLQPFLRLGVRQRQWEIGALLAAAAVQVLAMSRYDFWDQSLLKNRFLLVLVPLLAPLVGLAVSVLCRVASLDGDPAA